MLWFKRGSIIYINRYTQNRNDYYLILDYAEIVNNSMISITILDLTSSKIYVIDVSCIENKSIYKFLC